MAKPHVVSFVVVILSLAVVTLLEHTAAASACLRVRSF
jgi:hypothetical protein